MLYLVPGGRYLVTKDMYLRKLRLWDLGLPRTEAWRPKLITEIQSEGPPGAVSLSFPWIRWFWH